MTQHINISTGSLRAIALAMLLALPTAASASSDSDDIVVRSQSPMDEWTSQTTAELNRALSTGLNSRGQPNNAIVQVTFTLDENGQADDLEFLKGKGNRHSRDMARRAIRRLKNLDQVPVANAEDAQFLANIIFANNERVHTELASELEEMETARLASTERAATYIALGY